MKGKEGKKGYICQHEDIWNTKIVENSTCYKILMTIALNVDPETRQWNSTQIEAAKISNLSRLTINKWLKRLDSDEFDNIISVEFKHKGVVITLNENDFIVL